MFNTKIRSGLALFAATFAVALAVAPMAPAEAQAMVKSSPTGNSKLDDICQQMADLINHAKSQGDLALVNGDDEGAQAWYALADEMVKGGTARGCKFFSALRHHPGIDAHMEAVQTQTDAGGKQTPPMAPVRGLHVSS